MTENPENLSKRPEIHDGSESFHYTPKADVLTEILCTAGLQGRLFCRAKLRAPWALAIPSDRLAHFHYLERGVCRLTLEDQKEGFTLTAGDIAVLPGGPGHLLQDPAGGAPVAIGELVPAVPDRQACAQVRHGGGGMETQMVCGSFQFRPGREGFLLPLLPAVIVLPTFTAGAPPYLADTLRQLAQEAAHQRPGNQLVLTRLVEILFVQVLRAWLERQPQPSRGNWLAALGEERILAALGAIHARPAHPWSVAELAACAYMSRSPFAARFKKMVGESPMAYLRRWRVELAGDLLARTNLSVAQIAGRVGYHSETSFSKAFKAITGWAPIRWRRRARETTHGDQLHES